MDRGEAHITEAQRHDVQDEDSGSGKSLIVHKVLLTPEKEVEDASQRTRLFRTTCKTKGWKCKVIVDSRSTDNIVSTKMVEKLELETTDHLSPYKVIRIWTRGLKFAQFSKCSECDENGTIASVSFS
jgi:hypothetical protein